MNSFELARARQATYALFSRLFLRGVEPESLARLRQLPPLAAELPESLDLDQLAARHQDLFGFNIFPYEASFLAEDGQLGGAVTDAVISYYQQIGFQQSVEDSSPDHIGVELSALSFLCAAEGDAWEDGEASIAGQIQQRQAELISTHLGRWIIPLTVAVQVMEEPFFATATNLLIGFLEDHLSSLPFRIATPPASLATPPSLADEKTDLRDIARFLLTPAHSGLFISRYTIQTLGRELDVPRGFGKREQLLINLFKSAAYLDEIKNLLDGLGAWISAWEDQISRLKEQSPTITAIEPSWSDKVGQSKRLLAEMESGFNQMVIE